MMLLMLQSNLLLVLGLALMTFSPNLAIPPPGLDVEFADLQGGVLVDPPGQDESSAPVIGPPVDVEPVPFPFPTSPIVCPRFDYDAIYDLKNQVIASNSNVQLIEGLYGSRCQSKGVLKIALASAATDPTRRRALIDMFFEIPRGMTFNLGDSNTNDGWGGDGSTFSNDAEVHSLASSVLGYYNDYAGSGNAFKHQELYKQRLTLIAANNQVLWLSDNPSVDSYNFMADKGLFALNGQSDIEGNENFNLYLGMNKAVKSGSARIGVGLCKVGIKFLPEY